MNKSVLNKKNLVVVILMIILLCSLVFAGAFLLSFPIKYKNEIKYYASKYDLTASMVASIIKIESNYDPNAQSSAGAMGLMQILPSTAMDMCERMNIDFKTEDLFDYQKNLDIGCYYLKYLLNVFDGNITNTLSAYNWGMTNVKTWILKGNSDGYGTINNIPVRETKNYLKKYNSAKYMYHNIFGYDV